MRYVKQSMRRAIAGTTATLSVTASFWAGSQLQPPPADATVRPQATAAVATQTTGTATQNVGAAVARSAEMCEAEGWAPVKRKSVINRGKKWVKANVSYDQSDCHRTAAKQSDDEYRTDCSGFVSMVWALDRSYSTADFATDRTGRWHTIKWKNLKPGDAIVANTRTKNHIVLFVRWEDADHTQIKAYEEKGSAWGTIASVRGVSRMKSEGFHPIRYDHIQG